MADTGVPGLAGKRIGVTRARNQMHGAMQAVAEFGGIPVALPAIEFQTLPADTLGQAREAVRSSTWVVLSSVNAVRVIAQWPEFKGFQPGPGPRFAVMGPVTGRELRNSLGVEPASTYRPDGRLATQLRLAPTETATVLHSTAGPGPALSRLGADGDRVRAFPVYRTRCAEDLRAALACFGSSLDAVTFTSGSCVRCFAHGVRDQPGSHSLLRSTLVACMGATSREAAVAAGMRVDVYVEGMSFHDLLGGLVLRFRKCGAEQSDRQVP